MNSMNLSGRLLVVSVVLAVGRLVSQNCPGADSVTPAAITDSSRDSGFGSFKALQDYRNDSSAEAYQVIVKRNSFALQPAPPPLTQAVSVTPPDKDLLLTGLCDLDSVRSALFSLTEAGHPSKGFVLAEGEQNEWLEVLTVDTAGGTVKVRLKKPVIRVRSVGVDVVLSLQKA